MRTKILLILCAITFLVGCQQKVLDGKVTPPAKVPTNASTATPTKISPMVSPTNKPETWEDYLYSIIKNRDFELLFNQKNSQINLLEYLKQSKILIKGSPTEIEELKYFNQAAFLFDLDKDGVNELCLLQSEGSIRHHFVEIFKKKNNIYVDTSMAEGYIFPFKYNNEVHFISIENDFNTKFTNAVIEYEINGLSFKQKEIYIISFKYDVSQLPKSITKIIDDKFLNSLSNYKVSESSIAKIKQISESPCYDVDLVDNGNNNIFKFTFKLRTTSVGYAPNEWKFISRNEKTHKFNGTEQMVTHRAAGTDETVCFGLKFYKDEFGNIFILKVSYLYFTINVGKDGDLILQLFKFTKNSVEEVEKKIIQPKVVVQRG